MNRALTQTFKSESVRASKTFRTRNRLVQQESLSIRSPLVIA